VRPPSTTVPLPEGILRFGVAVIATGGYMLAADPRIECMIGPFDFRIFTHFESSYFAKPFCISERLSAVVFYRFHFLMRLVRFASSDGINNALRLKN
jgi:hypothetical protein